MPTASRAILVRMKRIDLDRSEITQALANEPSIGAAARSLGVARRTLQDRMRALGIPRGAAGRPTRKIRYARRTKRFAAYAAAATAFVGGALIGRHYFRGGK